MNGEGRSKDRVNYIDVNPEVGTEVSAVHFHVSLGFLLHSGNIYE